MIHSRLLHYYVTGFQHKKLSEESEPMMPHAQDYHRFFGTQITNTAERMWLVRETCSGGFIYTTRKIGTDVIEVLSCWFV